MKRFKKLLSVILVAAFVFSVVSIVATAEETESIQIKKYENNEPYIIDEAYYLRDEYSKTFIMSDGSYTTANYDSPVHYLDESGEWQDIDNSLTEKDGVLTNSDSNIDAAFSKKSDENSTVSVNVDGYDISWGLVGANKSNISVVEDKSTAKGDDSFLNLENLTSKTVYKDIFENVDAEYVTTSSGIKENIILKDKNSQNEFTVKYNFDGLTAKSVDEHTVELKNSDGKVIYNITAPVMTDSESNMSDKVSLSIVSDDEKSLTVKISADKEWLSSAKYPVTVDPSIEVNSQRELTLKRLSSDGESDDLFAGNVDGTDNVILVRTDISSKVPHGSVLTDAKLYLPSSSSYNGELSVYYVNDDHEDTDTWEKYAQRREQHATAYPMYSATSSETKVFDVSSVAQQFYNSGELCLSVESENDVYVPNITSDTYPRFTYNYALKAGINSNYSYHTVKQTGRLPKQPMTATAHQRQLQETKAIIKSFQPLKPMQTEIRY